jgi:hypothetical protein
MIYYFDTISPKTNDSTFDYFKRSFNWGDDTAESIVQSMHNNSTNKKRIHKMVFEIVSKGTHDNILKKIIYLITVNRDKCGPAVQIK